MQIGVIGLGRMGGNITRRLMENGHEAVVFDHDANAVAALGRDGAIGAKGLDALVRHLRAPRAIWPASQASGSRARAISTSWSSGCVSKRN